jgi:hypothetical protein
MMDGEEDFNNKEMIMEAVAVVEEIFVVEINLIVEALIMIINVVAVVVEDIDRILIINNVVDNLMTMIISLNIKEAIVGSCKIIIAIILINKMIDKDLDLE